MIATLYLKPCPICAKGKRCKGHVGDALLIRDEAVHVFFQKPRAAHVRQGSEKSQIAGKKQ